MTSKSDFTAEEWQLILEAPPSAGMIVVTAQRGGSFRETIAMAKDDEESGFYQLIFKGNVTSRRTMRLLW